MAKRVYLESVKKWAVKAGIPAGTMVGLIFMYLSFLGAIEITGFSGDQICAGTELDPCYAYVNFTAKEDVFIYPIGYDPWGRESIFEFSPGVESWKLQRSWGSGWRDIPLNETCTGTWCGAPNSDGVKYSWVLREGRDYQVRVIAYKNSPYERIKWAVNYEDREYLDPVWESPLNISNETEDNLLDENYIDSRRTSDSLREPLDDKYKSYYADEKRVLIEDSEYRTEIDMKLLTSYNEKVPSGDDVKIASILINDWKDSRTKLIDSISVYDKNDNHNKEPKNIWFKYKEVTTETDCYTPQINDSNDTKSNEICNDYEVVNWIKFDSLNELPSTGTEVGLFTKTISGEEYEWVMTVEGFEILEWASYLVTDLVSYYKLDENAGNTDVADAHGNNDGTASEDTEDLHDNDGIINSAFDLEKSNSEAINTNFNHNKNNDFSFSAWVKFESFSATGGYDNTIFSDGTGNDWSVLLRGGDIGSDNVIDAYGHDGSDNFFVRATGLSVDTWYHVVYLYDESAGEVELYINGVSKGTSTEGGSGYRSGATDIWLGKENSGGGRRYFDGLIDEVGIWERALSSDEVEDLWNGGDGLAYPFVVIVDCTFSGFIKDENNNALNNANITIWNQNNISENYETQSDVTGEWSINVTNSTNTYMVGAYYNNTLIGQLKPYISGTC